MEVRTDGYAKEALIELHLIEQQIMKTLGMASDVGPKPTDGQPELDLVAPTPASVAPGIGSDSVVGAVHD